MQIVNKRIGDLRPAEYNARRLTKQQAEDLKKSLEGFGVVEPAVVNVHPERMNIIIGGHQRVKVAKMLGHREFPCYEVSLSIEKERELNIRLNRNTGEWDFDALLKNFGHDDLLDWGFSEKEVEERSNEPIAVDEDEVPDAQERVRTSPGDLYELGPHRLLCGDTTVMENVDRLVGQEKLKMIFTSPPYNMNMNLYRGYRDNRDNRDFIVFNVQVLMNWKRLLAEGGFVFWNMSYNKNSGPSFLEVFYQFIHGSGLTFLEDIVWDKGHGLPLSDQLTRQYEHILVLNESAENIHYIDHIGVFGTKRVPFNKDRKRGITNYWRVDTFRSQSDTLKAAFPVELPLKAMEISSCPGDAVADCFGGSGTTLIAAEKAGRRAFLMELDPVNCDLTVERYVRTSGKSKIVLNGHEIDWRQQP